MKADMIAVFGTAIVAIGWAPVYFWLTGRKEAREARGIAGELQDVSVLVNGGYRPDRIALRRGRPIRLSFQRTYDGESWWDDLDFPYARVLRALPEGETVVVDVGPLEPGEYSFFSGLGTMRGTLVVEGEDAL